MIVELLFDWNAVWIRNKAFWISPNGVSTKAAQQ